MLVLLTTLLLTGEAWAQRSKRAQARSLAQSGVNAYDLGEFEKALTTFQQAYELYPDPDILYNIAQSHRKLGQHEKAIETYKAYLRNKPDAPDRGEVAEQINELTAVIESQKRAREKPPEGTRAPAAAEAERPQVPVVVSDADQSPSPPWYTDYGGWSLAGAGAAAIAVGTGLQLSAHSLESDLPGTPESERNALRDRVRSRRTIAAIGVVGGGALLVGGIVKLALRKGSERRGTAVSLAVGPGFAGVAGSF